MPFYNKYQKRKSSGSYFRLPGNGYKRRRIGGGNPRSGVRRGRGLGIRSRGWRGKRYGGGRGITGQLFSKGVFNNEINYVRTDVTGTFTKLSAAIKPVACITKVAAGDTSYTRDGFKIFLRHLNIKGALRWASNASVQDFATVNIMFVRDKSPATDTTTVSSGPDLNEILAMQQSTVPTSTVAALTGTIDWKQVYNVQQNRFQILWRKRYNILSNAAAGQSYRTTKKRLRIMKPVYYDDAPEANTAAPGHVWMYAWCNLRDTEGVVPEFAYTVRWSFTDV